MRTTGRDGLIRRAAAVLAGLLLLPILIIGWSTMQRTNVCFSDGNPYVEWQGDSCAEGWDAPGLLDYLWPPQHWPWNVQICHPRMDRLAGSDRCPPEAMSRPSPVARADGSSAAAL
jgi:hypothetical protein